MGKCQCINAWTFEGTVGRATQHTFGCCNRGLAAEQMKKSPRPSHTERPKQGSTISQQPYLESEDTIRGQDTEGKLSQP